MKILSSTVAVVCVLFAVVNPTLAQSLTFTTNTCTVGDSPDCIVAMDVNGDGKVDLVVQNSDASTPSLPGNLLVLTNNGSGVFVSNATLNVGVFPADLAAVDINGDGKLDLISVNSAGLLVLTNNEYGAFSSNATLTVAGAARFVTVADINEDAKLDLVVANSGINSLNIFTNNGNGIFGSNATYSVGVFPIGVVAADLNNDGKPDLVCANSNLHGTGTLTVLTNNGTGIFGSNATLVVGNHPVFVTAADVNGDGKLDLISANMVDNSLTVLTNSGTGVFGSNATLKVGVSPVCIAVADINGDGKMDLVCVNSFDNTLTVLTNNASGAFGFNATLYVGRGPGWVVTADINNDGKLDLVSANSSTNTLTVLTQVMVGQPTLKIATTNGNDVVVFWSSFSTGFTLQTNADLCSTNWSPTGYATSISNGTNQSVTLPSPPSGNLFFRLKQ